MERQHACPIRVLALALLQTTARENNDILAALSAVQEAFHGHCGPGEAGARSSTLGPRGDSCVKVEATASRGVQGSLRGRDASPLPQLHYSCPKVPLRFAGDGAHKQMTTVSLFSLPLTCPAGALAFLEGIHGASALGFKARKKLFLDKLHSQADIAM
eukprot:1156818-Pelagomonas_calceolata.AAC.7